MAFKFNKGSQVIGDLVSADDPERNTKIDFGNDQINFVVSGTVVASITPNQFSASVLVGNGSSLTGISGGGGGGTSYPLTVSGTSATGVTYNNTVSKITFDNATGFQVSQSAPNEVLLSIGSHYKNIIVQGQTTLSATGSDDLEFKGLGGVTITTSLIDSNANGISKEVTFSTTILSSSLDNRLTTLENNSISNDFFGGQFGDASDGDLTVVGTFTAAREMHFKNLIMPDGAVFKPNGHRIFVSNTLYISSSASFNDDGINATNQAGGAGLASRNYLIGTSAQGGNGVALTAINFANGGNGNAISNASLNNFGQAPNGSRGGNVTLRANTGGTGGTATTIVQKWNGAWSIGRYSAGGFNGGAAGGGGAINVTAYTSGTFTSGGGGGGGGNVWIAARYINNQGRISANGGKGANGILSTGTAECCGGGGGGGGNVTVITQTTSSLGTIQANGGAGGISAYNTGTGVNTNGVDGISGSVCIVVLK